VRPTGPATGFGYIRPGEPAGHGVFRVAAFVEKPDLETARRYVAEGYLWNSGNFAFQAATLLGELGGSSPAWSRGPGRPSPTPWSSRAWCGWTRPASRAPPASRSTTR
jgi:hypothetical protein